MDEKEKKQELKKLRLEKKKKVKKIINNVLAILIAVTAVSLLIWIFNNPTKLDIADANEYSDEFLTSLVTCLNEHGAVLYTMPTCPHCIEQKSYFGKYIEDINNVDCSTNKATCKELNITGVPTWAFNNNETIVGGYSLDILSSFVGCENE